MNQKSPLKNKNLKSKESQLDQKSDVTSDLKSDYIPKKRREEVWDKWIGASIGVADCLLCQKNELKQGACNGWDCGHVVSRWNGGNTSIFNLRPICKGCNSSMGRRNMTDYCEIYEQNSPILETIKNVSWDSMTANTSGICVVCNIKDRNGEMLYCGIECKKKADDENSVASEENLKCTYCNKKFQTKYGLKKHLESADFCLKLRGETCEKVICEYCERKVVKKDYNMHACKNKIKALGSKKAEDSKIQNSSEIFCEIDVAIENKTVVVEVPQTINNISNMEHLNKSCNITECKVGKEIMPYIEKIQDLELNQVLLLSKIEYLEKEIFLIKMSIESKETI